MRPIGVVAAAATLCFVTTACSTGPDSDAPPAASPKPATGPPVATGRPDAAAPESPEPAATGTVSTPLGSGRTSPGAPSTGPSRQQFGEPFSYGNGLRVRIDAPEDFTPSAWVERLDGTARRLKVTIENRTGDEFNPSQLHVRLRSPYGPAVQIFDYESDVIARPEERLKDGAEVTFRVGYWVTDEDVVVEFAPGFGYDPTMVVARP